MKANGNKSNSLTLRPEVIIRGARYVITSESKRRMVLERLDGDFSDYRRRLGISQIDMATRLKLSQAQLSRLENGSRSVKPEIEDKCRQLVKRAEKSI